MESEPRGQRNRTRERKLARTPGTLLGIGATLALHLMVFVTPVWFGGSSTVIHTTEQGGEVSGVPAMIVLDLEHEADQRTEAEDDSAHAIVAPSRLLLPIGAIELKESATLSQADAAPGHSQAAEPSDSERALTFGRYLDQVRARIERAWLRPREPIGADQFLCLVEISQDKQRNVKEVTLKRCNGPLRWQLSLVQAIQTASPFPAPPDPAVFSEKLTFELSANAFVEGGASEGYEPEFKSARTDR